jgi:hypothetical protein
MAEVCTMTLYRVSWEIDIDAECPVDAAAKTLRIQRDPESIATVFKVRERGPGKWFVQEIDLSE